MATLGKKSKWDDESDDDDDDPPQRPSSQLPRVGSSQAIRSETRENDRDGGSEDGEIKDEETDTMAVDTVASEERQKELELRNKALSQMRSATAQSDTQGGAGDTFEEPNGSTAMNFDEEVLSPVVGDGIIPFNLSACRNVDVAFESQIRIDEGTYGVVFQATDSQTGEKVALKRVKLTKEREGFPITALREVTILLKLQHPNIINVREVVVDRSLQKVYMVMDFAEHDLKGLMEVMRHPFTQSEVKCLMQQLISAVAYMHGQWILHRDLKLSNLLYTNRGELKVCDFGLSRTYGDPLRNMTSLVVTLWYRAPELLLGCVPLAPQSGLQYKYSTPIDLWSCGCIFAEILLDEPLFPGKGEHNEIDLIFKCLGTPTESLWPGWSKLPGAKNIQWKQNTKNNLRSKFSNPTVGFAGGHGGAVLTDAGYDLMMQMLAYNPDKRISAEDAINHKYFKDAPAACELEFMPTYPATQDANKKKRRREKTPELIQNEDENDESRYTRNDDRKYALPQTDQRSMRDQLLRQLAQMEGKGPKR